MLRCLKWKTRIERHYLLYGVNETLPYALLLLTGLENIRYRLCPQMHIDCQIRKHRYSESHT